MSVLIVGLSLTSSISLVSAEQLKPKNLYEQTRPAVFIVTKEFKCMITVPKVNLDDYLYDKIRGSLKKSGEKKTAGAITDAMVSEFNERPSAYLQTSGVLRDFDAVFTGMGSGFLATPRGHIITNAHVVNLQWAHVIPLVKKKYMARDCLRLIGQMQSEFRELKGMTKGEQDEMIKTMYPGLEKFYRKYTRLKWTRNCKAIMRFVDADGDVQLREYPAEVVRTGRSTPGKDVAVLKIEATRLPQCLPLGDETNLNVGDEIYVVGFPSAATFNPSLAKSSAAEATLTRGIISAKKTMPAGWTVLQHDAATSGGSSGGPALDSSGRVIGIHTWHALDAGAEVQGSNFVVPISVVREMLERAGVRLEDSSPQKDKPEASKTLPSDQPKPDTGDESALQKR